MVFEVEISNYFELLEDEKKMLFQLCSKENTNKCVVDIFFWWNFIRVNRFSTLSIEREISIECSNHPTHTLTKRAHNILCEYEWALVKMKLDVAGILYDYIRSIFLRMQWAIRKNIYHVYISFEFKTIALMFSISRHTDAMKFPFSSDWYLIPSTAPQFDWILRCEFNTSWKS